MTAYEPRYRVDQDRKFKFSVRAGNGTRVLFSSWRWLTAHRVAQELESAFLDGKFVAMESKS